MLNVQQIHISDYDYSLPDARIAKFPLARRDQSKLLVYRHGQVTEDLFANLPCYLPQGSLMVFNNTRVIQARLHFRKATGALIEVFLLEPVIPADYEQMFQMRGACSWNCLIGNLKKWKEGALSMNIELPASSRPVTLTVEQVATDKPATRDAHLVRFNWDDADVTFADIIDAVGELPIPPYLNRKTQESDKTTYQTVYSKIKGSVAAPTAGLHFTEQVLQQLDDRGIDREELTLHVGAGTFRPVKSVELQGHEMHTEYVSVRRSTIERLIAHDAQAIAVGTTSVRTLESLYYMGCRLQATPDATEQQLHVEQWEPYTSTSTLTPIQALQNILQWLQRNELDALHSSTQIIIAPGYHYKIVEALVTNFHQPQSTLLLLVSAFVNGDWRTIYDYALTHDFRFLSYGDSSLLIP